MKFKFSMLVVLVFSLFVLCSFAFSNLDDMLNKKDITQYKESLDVEKTVKKEDKTHMTVAKKGSLKDLKGFKFSTLDLDGNKVTNDVLKKAKVTMVNIWATWCPPCRAELPDIGNLAKKYKAKGCQVLAICSDVTDEDISPLQTAKDIIKNANCDEVIVLRRDKSMESIYEHIRAFPTTIFFDAKGNVIPPIIVGGRSEGDFAKAFDECLKKVK